MKDLSIFSATYETFPNVLVVGCGDTGSSLVKTIIDIVPHNFCRIYVTDSDKERARKLSEYRISMITPIKWSDAKDTPDDVDIIVIAVNRETEHKVIDRIIESKLPFISFCDDANVYETYLDIEDILIQNKIYGVVGSGIIPGLSDVLTKYVSKKFKKVNDISISRIGFASKSSLNSIKNARKDNPLSIRDGRVSVARRDAGTLLSWFPSPYNLVECQSVATGVFPIQRSFNDIHNITVAFGEPRLPTFNERIKNILLKVPLPSTNTLLKIEAHGIGDNGFDTLTLCIVGDAMAIVMATTITTLYSLFMNDIEPTRSIISVADIINVDIYLEQLIKSCAQLYQFVGIST